ncbi:unnamed protein product, partial [Closterium sp. NIES-53]
LHLPSFSMNFVSTAALQDAMVTTTTPGGQRVSICTCTRTGRHLATFTRRPGSSLYTLSTEPPQTLLRHHCLGHPSLPRLRGMHSRLLVSGLPRSLPPLLPSPATPCLPCIKGQQRAAPHSSSFPPTTAPLQTLHMDVWGPARVIGQGRERYFLPVVNDYTRYTMIFPLRSKGEVVDVLIPWVHTDFCRGEGILQSFTLPDSPQQNGIAEHRIGLVMEVARTSMIHAAAPHFLWPFAVRYAANQLNLWPRVSLPETSPTLRWTGEVGDASVFRVWANKLSARVIPCVFLGFVPDAPSWQFYHPTLRRVLPSPFYQLFPYRSTLPPPPLPPLFLAPGPPPVDPLPPKGPSPSGVSKVDPLSGTVPIQVAIGSGAALGTASGGAASGGAELGVAESGGAGSRGAEPRGEEPRGVEPARVVTGGAEPEGVEPWGAESEGAESGGAEPRGAPSTGGPAGALPRLSPQQLREWLVQHARLRSGAAGAGGNGDARAGGAGVPAGANGTGGTVAAGPRGARTRGTGAAGTSDVGDAGAGDPTKPRATGAGDSCAGGAGAGGTGAGGAGGAGVRGTGAGGAGAAGAGAVDPRAGGAGGTVRPQPYFSQPPLLSASPLPAPSHTEHFRGLTARRERASRPVSPVRTARRVPRSRPLPVPGTHAMTLRPSSLPPRVPLPAPPESSPLEVPDPEFDPTRGASPTVSRLLATAVTDPSFESAAPSALVAELLDFAVVCRLDNATALVADSAASESASPPSIGGECALGTDVLEDRQEDFECLAAAVPRFASILLAPEGDPDAPDIPTPRSYAEAILGPYSSQWQAAMDAEMASWKSTGTYVDEVPPPGANIVDGMWIFRVKQPPGSPPAFKARYVARGFSQRQGVDYFRTFSPTLKMTTLRVLLHVAAQRDYELHSLDFSKAFLTTLAALGFAPSIADPSLFLRTDTTLPPFYVLVYVLQRFGFQFSLPQPTPLSTSHSLSAPPSDESVQPSSPYPELVGCLMYLMTCTRSDLAYPLSLLAHYVAPGRHRKVHWDAAKKVLHYLWSTSGMGLVLGGRGQVVLTGHADVSRVDDSATQRLSQGYTFSLGSNSVSWRSIRSSSVLSSCCDTEIYAGAMAAQELRWLTYLLSDLGEQPRSPPFLYVDNKAMIALCQEHRLEHRTKHIALRYFLARELHHRVQLRLAYVATRANTADIFNKALPPGDHQRFSTVLGLLALLFLTGLVTTCSPPLCLWGSICEAEIYAGVMAAQELRCLTYLLTDLGEQPRSPPVLYVDNKAMIALCQEHRLEHRTKHIALRYFLARELQQRGHLRLAYVASRANTADIFTKALPPGDHQRFSTVFGLVPTLPCLLTT